MANRVEEPPPNHAIHQLPHYRQRFDWDCGVTCVLMLLPPAQRQELLGSFHQICAEEGFHQSTWTIDLCYLLKRFGIEHHMYTTTPGVNEAYRKHGYYDKIIDMDVSRVRRRFADAAQRGVRVSARALGEAALAQHVRANGPALLLADGTRLACDSCKRHKLAAELRHWFGGEYSGHYICVVGLVGGKFVYRDPALPPRLCVVRPRTLARARVAATDKDVVLVYRDYRPAPSPAATDPKATIVPKVTTCDTTVPRATTAPSVTTVPKVTTSPSDTTVPRATTAPSVTTVPKVTTSPSDTTVPRAMTAPSVTTVPKVTTSPSDTTVPRATTAPSVTTVPKVTTAPSVTTVPKVTTAPSVTTVHKATIGPSATTVPSVATAPSATTVPSVATAPSVTTVPSVAAAPSVTTVPSVTTAPSVTTVPTVMSVPTVTTALPTTPPAAPR